MVADSLFLRVFNSFVSPPPRCRYYKNKVTHIKADRPAAKVAAQIKQTLG